MTTGRAGNSYAIFVVEDEALIRMMIIEMLEEMGHCVSGEAGQIDQALSMARSAEFDLAILDVNMAGRIVTPVAEIIALRNRPIIFATGYAPEAIPEPFRNRPALRKPFMLENLQQTINLAMSAQDSGPADFNTSQIRNAVPIRTFSFDGADHLGFPRQA